MWLEAWALLQLFYRTHRCLYFHWTGTTQLPGCPDKTDTHTHMPSAPAQLNTFAYIVHLMPTQELDEAMIARLMQDDALSALMVALGSKYPQVCWLRQSDYHRSLFLCMSCGSAHCHSLVGGLLSSVCMGDCKFSEMWINQPVHYSVTYTMNYNLHCVRSYHPVDRTEWAIWSMSHIIFLASFTTQVAQLSILQDATDTIRTWNITILSTRPGSSAVQWSTQRIKAWPCQHKVIELRYNSRPFSSTLIPSTHSPRTPPHPLVVGVSLHRPPLPFRC